MAQFTGGSASAGNAAQQLNENVEATVARIRELNERAIEAARAAGTASLDAYEKALQSFVSVEERLPRAPQRHPARLGEGDRRRPGRVRAEHQRGLRQRCPRHAEPPVTPGEQSFGPACS